jgi:putative CocE/NonD family hydrolase
MKSQIKNFALSLAICLLVYQIPSSAQSIEGDWYGSADINGTQLRINVHVKRSDGGYTSTWDSPDQDAMGIPSSSTIFSYPDFHFSYDFSEFSYTGKVNADYTEINGFVQQHDLKTEVVFRRTPVAISGNIQDIRERYSKQEVYIQMRDGIKLFTSIYTPKNSQGKNPILINRTPYNIEPGGPESFNAFFKAYSRFTNDNYIMVFQDVRGKYMSEGTFEDIRPVIPVKKTNKDIDESTDIWDTVDWLVKNVEGNNGNVGIFGISYPGFYSTMSLIGSHPAVKAVSPQAPVTAWFIGDDFHHNGAFFLLDCFTFYYSHGRAFKHPTRQEFPRFKFPVPDNYEFFISKGAIKNLAPIIGDSIKFWNDAFAHPDYDAFWKTRDPRQYLKNVTPAVLTVGGWFDAEDLYGTLHTYEAIEKQNPSSLPNRIVMGPWFHSQWIAGKANHLGNIYWGQDANALFSEYEKKFFDYYLKGEGDENFPEALMFVTGKNEWKKFGKWPPEGTEKQKIYLQAGQSATFSSPTVSGFDEYVSDPMKPVPYTADVHTERTAEYMTDDQRFASRRPDVMVYETDVLSEDITLTGPLTADLFVSTTGTDADFVVKLIDVFPPDTKNTEKTVKVPLGGYQMLVRGEVFRGKYRNSFEKPEPFTPGKVTEVKYELPDVSHVFLKGHRIMIQVQNSWFPLVDRNPQKFVNIYKCSDSDFQKATMRIYHSPEYPSAIEIPVLK